MKSYVIDTPKAVAKHCADTRRPQPVHSAKKIIF